MSDKQSDMTDFLDDKNAAAIRVPDLDWLALTAEDTKNIPVPLNIEAIPELQENWKRTGEANLNFVPNKIRSEETLPSEKISEENIRDLVYAAKKEMMKGVTGKALAQKLASTYPKNLIKAASEELKKLSAEQGLLGNVYIDISPYDSCEEASRLLGSSRIRLAKYVVGKPRRRVCSSHKNGYCKELHKNVMTEMQYTPDVFNSYTTHLRMAGLIGPEDVIDSKDLLRDAFLRSAQEKKPVEKKAETQPEVKVSQKDLSEMVLKEAAVAEKDKALMRFMSIRPVLAFIQNEMLKGKIGKALEEVLFKKYLKEDLAKYASEIKKVASLQGLLGNVYVDVSFYKDADEAIKAIKNASVHPSYLIQSYKKGSFDNTLEVVSANTGCEILPRNGKIDKKVARSYLEDLQFSQRISSDKAIEAKRKLEAGENILGILREAFLSTLEHKRPIREGGVQASFYQDDPGRRVSNRDKLKEATYKAVEAGFPIEKIEDKLIKQIPTAEAIGMVRTVLAAVKEIDANVLTKCAKEKYQFSLDVRLKKAKKCSDCIMCATGGCTKLGLKFAAEDKKEDKKDASNLNLDPHTEKVLFSENPDISQMNIRKEFDMPDYIGSNVNVALDKMRGQEKLSMEITFNNEGIDENLKSVV
jgi:HEPN domain-containing protein